MLFQVVTLTFPDGDETKYVDQVGTEDAAESCFLLDQHRSEGEPGTLRICKLVEVSQ